MDLTSASITSGYIASPSSCQKRPGLPVDQCPTECKLLRLSEPTVDKNIFEFNIVSLPHTVLENIFTYCRPFDFSRIRRVCRKFHECAKNRVLSSALLTSNSQDRNKFLKVIRDAEKLLWDAQAFTSALEVLLKLPEERGSGAVSMTRNKVLEGIWQANKLCWVGQDFAALLEVLLKLPEERGSGAVSMTRNKVLEGIRQANKLCWDSQVFATFLELQKNNPGNSDLDKIVLDLQQALTSGSR